MAAQCTFQFKNIWLVTSRLYHPQSHCDLIVIATAQVKNQMASGARVTPNKTTPCLNTCLNRWLNYLTTHRARVNNKTTPLFKHLFKQVVKLFNHPSGATLSGAPNPRP